MSQLLQLVVPSALDVEQLAVSAWVLQLRPQVAMMWPAVLEASGLVVTERQLMMLQ